VFHWLSRFFQVKVESGKRKVTTRKARFTSPSSLSAQRCPPRVEELEPRLVLATNLFTVPGAANAQTALEFVWTRREAAYNNEVGVFVAQDATGTVNGIAPGASGYVQAALQSAQVLFASGSGPGQRHTLTFTAGQQLGFYLVQNSSTEQALQTNPADTGGGIFTFFSVDNVNPDAFDHVRTQTLGDATEEFAWEDGTKGGDKDFNDVKMTVGIAGNRATSVPGQKGQTVPTTFSWLSRDAAYNNELGLFTVDDAAGHIGTLAAGDSGYAQAALSSSTRQVLFASGQTAGASATVNLPGGGFFALYLVVNDTTDSALANNPTNSALNRPFVWFAFPAANFDGFDHLLWLSSTDFAFEDAISGGDQDFNDLVGRVSFGTPQGTPTSTGPTITGQLANDTGASKTDKITNDPSTQGTLTSSNKVTSFTAGFDSTPAANFTNVLGDLKADNSYLFDSNRLQQINGAPLTDGSHTLHLQATDSSGQSTSFDVAFTLDTTPPAQPVFDLDAASDTGTKGDGQTASTTVTLVGTTDANTSVQLVQTGATVTADASGNFSFVGITLAAGANPFTVKATDVAGNTSQSDKTITRTTPNNAPTVTSPIASVSLAQQASQTIDLAGNFTDADISNSVVRLDTPAGPINIQLFDKQAPRTVANFLNYVTSGRYASSIFHRSVPNFVLQGGGFTFNTNPSRLDPIATDPAVQNEPDPTNRSNLRGTLAMAKLGSDPNSATDQFFFNLANNSANLDNQNGGFTVFGQVVGAADQAVVDALAAIPTQDQSNAAALPPSEKGVFNQIPLQNYTGTNFPTDTVAANYAFVTGATLVRQIEALTYSVVGNTNPTVASTSVVNERLTVTAGQAGTTTITVRATDKSGATVDTSFNVTVT